MNAKTRKIVAKLRSAEERWNRLHPGRTPSVRELAEMADISPSSVSKFSTITKKRGQGTPTPKVEHRCLDCGTVVTGKMPRCYSCWKQEQKKRPAPPLVDTDPLVVDEKPKAQPNDETTGDSPKVDTSGFTVQLDIGAQLQSQIEEAVKQARADAEAELDSKLDAVALKAAEAATPPVLNITIGDLPPVVVGDGDQAYHEAFPKALKILGALKQLWLLGETGGGKTHMAAQLAEAVSQPFYCISCTQGMPEGHVIGRLGFENTYLPADFVKAYENGGVFLFDEWDAMNDNARLVSNSALSNGHMSLPNRVSNPTAVRHKDFYCIVATNSAGSGATKAYSGRDTIDLASQDRFAMAKVYVGYDERFESRIKQLDDHSVNGKSVRQILMTIRKNIKESKIPGRAMSTRTMLETAKLLSAELDPKDILNTYFVGWNDTEKGKALQGVTI